MAANKAIESDSSGLSLPAVGGPMRISPPLKVAAVVAFVGTIFAVGGWLLNFWAEPLAADSDKWAEFGSYLGGTLAPILAFASFIGLLVSVNDQAKARIEEESRADSMAHYSNATRSLERALTVFIGPDGVPISDRLVWLTVARLILSAKSVSRKITVPSIREMFSADEEFVRRRFYDIIQPTSADTPMANATYFTLGEERLHGNIIDERSIRVIYAFTEWPVDQEDPIEGVARFADKEIESMVLGRRGIADFVRARRRGAGRT